MMHIAIPSKGRPDGVKSLKYLPRATVYVPMSEVEGYRKCGVEDVIGVPVLGITKTRNWILDNNPEEKWVVFVDDDVEKAGMWVFGEEDKKCVEMEELQWWREFERLFDVMEGLGYRVWGLDTIGDPKACHPTSPFVFHTYLTASCMGMINDPSLRFDEDFPVKEDYELGLRCIQEDGGILGARYFFWKNSHWKDGGGCATYRTQQMEEKVTRKLMKMYPGMIRRVVKGGSEYSIMIDFSYS